MSFVDVVVTEYGAVKLSEKTLAWLSYQHPDWREVMRNKRLRNVRAQFARRQFADLETAVRIAASIEWAAGGLLTEF